MCCNMLRCAAAVLQSVAVCFSSPVCVAVSRSMLQHIAMHCSVLLQCCRVLQCVALYCTVLQSAAVCCSVLYTHPTTQSVSARSLLSPVFVAVWRGVRRCGALCCCSAAVCCSVWQYAAYPSNDSDGVSVKSSLSGARCVWSTHECTHIYQNVNM